MLSENDKKFLEWEFEAFIDSFPEIYEFTLILRQLLRIVEYSDKLKPKCSARYTEKIIRIKSDELLKITLGKLTVLYSDLVGIESNRIPCGIAFLIWKILERTKGNKSDINWARELLKANGKLSRLIAEKNLNFSLPQVPMYEQSNSDWARVLKQDMFRTATYRISFGKNSKKLNDDQIELREHYLKNISKISFIYFDVTDDDLDFIKYLVESDSLPSLEELKVIMKEIGFSFIYRNEAF
jgi:hypothetical protein